VSAKEALEQASLEFQNIDHGESHRAGEQDEGGYGYGAAEAGSTTNSLL